MQTPKALCLTSIKSNSCLINNLLIDNDYTGWKANINRPNNTFNNGT